MTPSDNATAQLWETFRAGGGADGRGGSLPVPWYCRFGARRCDLARIAAVAHALCDRDEVEGAGLGVAPSQPPSHHDGRPAGNRHPVDTAGAV